MKFIHVLIFVLSVVVLQPLWGKPSQQRPNIIFFLVDDMGWQDTSVPFWEDDQGHPKKTFLNKRYKTPNMESLAAQGMVFTNAYAQPVCSPSRVSLMSGMNSARHRVTNWTLNRDTVTDANSPFIQPPTDWNINSLQPEGTASGGITRLPITGETISYKMKRPFLTATTLPQLLKQQGYVTIHCGKAHWGTRNTPGANPLNLGFDYNIAGTEIGGPADYRGSQKYGSGPFKIRGLDENNYVTEDVFLTEALTQEAIKRLDAIRRDPEESQKPFYLYMSHYAVHAPFDQRGYDRRFADHYKRPNDRKPWSDNEKRYAGLLEGMDKSLGDLMAWLKRNKLDKNTVILFMGDNGGLAISGRMGDQWSNYPLSFGKGSGHEGGIREPMIVSWPGVTKPGSRNHTPIIIEDFFPSILEIAGLSRPQTLQKLDGISFVPQLEGKRGDMKRPLLFHYPHLWGEGSSFGIHYTAFTALRLGDWKLIYRHQDQNFELFNIKEDISETNNLADKNPQQLKKMAIDMTRLLKERQALMPTYKPGNKIGAKPGSLVPWPDEAVTRRTQKK